MTTQNAYCDVCNEKVQESAAFRIPPDGFRVLLSRGWGVHSSNIQMITSSGVSIESATMILTMQAAMSQSDWLLCASCKGVADRVLSGKSIASDADDLLDQIDLKKGEAVGKIYSCPPDSCDQCGQSFDDSTMFVDGRLKGDLMWSIMCADCFNSHGEGIGWGNGQLYMKRADGDWLMVAGFPPDDAG